MLETVASESPGLAEFSAHALSSAGTILAPENAGVGDVRVAHLLLCEAFVAAARAVTGVETLRTVAEARAELEGRADRPAELSGSRWSEVCRVLEDRSESRRESLAEAELVVGDLVGWARGQQRRNRLPWPWVVAIGVVAAMLVLVLPRLGPIPGWPSFTWKASSAFEGFADSGTLGSDEETELLFHTALETKPWVLIDLQVPRRISRITLENRQDCCFERGLPLVVEVGSRPDALREIGRQSTLFNEWKLEFPARDVRYVRLRADAVTYLHLRRVEIE